MKCRSQQSDVAKVYLLADKVKCIYAKLQSFLNRKKFCLFVLVHMNKRDVRYKTLRQQLNKVNCGQHTVFHKSHVTLQYEYY